MGVSVYAFKVKDAHRRAVVAPELFELVKKALVLNRSKPSAHDGEQLLERSTSMAPRDGNENVHIVRFPV